MNELEDYKKKMQDVVAQYNKNADIQKQLEATLNKLSGVIEYLNEKAAAEHKSKFEKENK